MAGPLASIRKARIGTSTTVTRVAPVPRTSLPTVFATGAVGRGAAAVGKMLASKLHEPRPIRDQPVGERNPVGNIGVLQQRRQLLREATGLLRDARPGDRHREPDEQRERGENYPGRGAASQSLRRSTHELAHQGRNHVGEKKCQHEDKHGPADREDEVEAAEHQTRGPNDLGSASIEGKHVGWFVGEQGQQ